LLSIILVSCTSDTTNEDALVENEKPTAVNDSYSTAKGKTITISDLLSNDTVIAGTSITSFENNSTNNGSIIDNNDGTYNYIPPTNFIGEDTFNYTLCDNDETPDCSTATVTVTVFEPVTFSIPANLSTYYSNLSVTTDTDLNYKFISSHTTDKHTTILSYGERHGFLYDADEDATNTANVQCQF